METKKIYTFLQQAFVFAFIMLLANLIVGILPFPMPASGGYLYQGPQEE